MQGGSHHTSYYLIPTKILLNYSIEKVFWKVARSTDTTITTICNLHLYPLNNTIFKTDLSCAINMLINDMDTWKAGAIEEGTSIYHVAQVAGAHSSHYISWR